ncbi:hypothetical protein CLU79DRAFT_388656 [Phycomyces nitens]|nr:hypothetical protein CLU79DRAFT_388656 [Phycomyces nitens]
MVDFNELFENHSFVSELSRIIKQGDPKVLTPLNIRRALEEKFDLEHKALDEKPWKTTLNGMIDQIFMDTTQKDPTDEEMSELESDEPKKKARKPKADSKDIPKPKKNVKKRANEKPNNEDESEMSDLDTLPNKKHKGTSRDSDSSLPSQPKKATKSKDKASTGATPNEEKIKRLKQYVSKCGVRKQWAKEFSDCTNDRQQIKRLQEILVELGVEGRPTIEKCEKVKMQREIKDELASLDTQNILDDDKGIHTRGKRVRKPRNIIEDSEDEDEEKPASFDISFLGDQSSDSE